MERFGEFPPQQTVEARLDELLGPVVATFTVTDTPGGTEPSVIREQWVGLSLPVREQLAEQSDEAVFVHGYEAVQALAGAGRQVAAEYWRVRESETTVLWFGRSEGEYAPVEA